MKVAQSANGKSFGALIQLLETERGPLVRFAYSTGGAARRGPVTLRPQDMTKLASALEKTPKLKAVLRSFVYDG